MTDGTGRADGDGDTPEPDGRGRWQRTVAIVGLALLLLVVGLFVVKGSGGHGPDRHGVGATPAETTGLGGEDPVQAGAQRGAHTPPAGARG